MKQNEYNIKASNRFQTVIIFLRKQLGWKASDPLVGVNMPARLRSMNNAHFGTVYIYQLGILSRS
jgi:hypothetical protein